MSLGFALIGCGEIAVRNAESIVKADRARLVRVVDIDADAAARLAEDFGVSSSQSLAEALADSAVSAVFLATPHQLHAEQIVTAAQAGRHVIVEKPIATSSEMAKHAIAACYASGVSLSVCHPRRYEPKVELARRLVEAGLIGRVLMTATSFAKVKPAEYWSRTWRACRERSGGGVLIMNLIHHFDALQVITDEQIVALHADCATLASDIEVEDSAVAILRYQGGALGTVLAGTALPGPKVFDDVVYGSGGRIVVSKHGVSLFTEKTSEHGPAGQWIEFPFEQDLTSKSRFVAEFVAAVLAGREVPVPASYGLGLLTLIERAYNLQGKHETRSLTE